MLVRPELQALRSNDAPQRRAQDAVGQVIEAWRSGAQGRQANHELRKFGEGTLLEDLPLLSSLFLGQESGANEFVAGLLKPLIASMAAEPLTQSPLRYSCNGALTTLVIARHDTSTLTLQAVNGALLGTLPEPKTVSFSPGETYEHVLAGSADVLRVRVAEQFPDKAVLASEVVTLHPGFVQHRAGRSEAQLLRRVSGCLVTLKLGRIVSPHEVAREYSLADGKLLRQAAGTPRESRLELVTALLGRMGRTDAAPLLAAMTEEQGNPSLRWQSLRECLGLDTARGFAALSSIARRADDPLAAPAGALRAQLLEAHPQLAGADQCPA